jgi:hypothetical protein
MLISSIIVDCPLIVVVVVLWIQCKGQGRSCQGTKEGCRRSRRISVVVVVQLLLDWSFPLLKTLQKKKENTQAKGFTLVVLTMTTPVG